MGETPGTVGVRGGGPALQLKHSWRADALYPLTDEEGGPLKYREEGEDRERVANVRSRGMGSGVLRGRENRRWGVWGNKDLSRERDALEPFFPLCPFPPSLF